MRYHTKSHIQNQLQKCTAKQLALLANKRDGKVPDMKYAHYYNVLVLKDTTIQNRTHRVDAKISTMRVGTRRRYFTFKSC